MGVTPWWLGYAPAEAQVACGGATHRLRWEAGELRALDHGEPEAERTLAALGGERCACVDMLEAWQRHAADPRVLTLASRGPADPLAVARPQPGVRRAAGGWSPVRGVPAPEPEDELVTLLGLGGGLADRLAATVAAVWAGRADGPSAEVGAVLPQLHAALYGRVAATLRTWLGQPGLELELLLVRERDPRRLVAAGDGARAVLPFAWLAEVWARGLATVWGRFVVAATTSDGARWALTTIGPELGAPRELTIELPG